MSRKAKPKPLLIEGSVSLPAPRTRYPFAQMEVGDSFFAEHYHNAQSAAHSYGKHHGWKFTVRAEGSGVRVWRIE